MTSTLRHLAIRKEGLTLFIKPESPTYTEDGVDRLFPFSYNDGELDISYAGNTFKSSMVDTTGVSPDSETDTAIRILSGPRLVTSLGENFKAYIRAWRDGSIDSGSPIEIYQPSQVLRVQEADYSDVTANSGDSYIVSTSAPAGDNYIVGTPTNGYYTKYVFKTPLTFTIVESGVTKYITFRTILDQE